jgi:hypothetical protein
MFALLAAVSFALAFFGVTIFDGHSLVILGLVFLAAHHLFDYRPWAGRRVNVR